MLTSAFPGPVRASGLIGSDQIQSRLGWGSNLANASHAARSAEGTGIPVPVIVTTAVTIYTLPVGQLG